LSSHRGDGRRDERDARDPEGGRGARPPIAATKLLYFADPLCRAFAAEVLDVRAVTAPAGAAWAVALDETAFYPGGGGQAPDRGTLGGAPLVAIGPDPEQPEVILHYLGPAGFQKTGAPSCQAPHAPGQRVACEVDWPHRYDLMQHHTAQHILSAVAQRDLDAPTTGFHLTAETATVDLALDPGTLGDPAGVERVVDRLELSAAAMAFADRPVEIHMVAAGERPAGDAGDLRLRQRGPRPKGGETWRVVGIPDLDLSPCGGTHVTSTGQVGLITIQRWEKVRDSLRLEYACGYRALAAAAWRRQALRRLGQALTVHERDAADAALRHVAEAGQRAKELRALRQELLRHEAAALLAGAEMLPGGRLVVLSRDDLEPEQLQTLASWLVAESRVLALLAARQAVPRLAFARSEDLSHVDAGKLMALAVAALGGRGGGSPKSAQGGGGDAGRLGEALAAAAAQARAALGRTDAGDGR
jgi:alanyl-tRNA synthetase